MNILLVFSKNIIMTREKEIYSVKRFFINESKKKFYKSVEKDWWSNGKITKIIEEYIRAKTSKKNLYASENKKKDWEFVF